MRVYECVYACNSCPCLSVCNACPCLSALASLPPELSSALQEASSFTVATFGAIEEANTGQALRRAAAADDQLSLLLCFYVSEGGVMRMAEQ